MNTCPKCGTKFSATTRLCPQDGTVLEPDQSTEQQQVGKVLDGKYHLDSYLSRGGMGAVYRATHVMLGRPVAVKLINPDLLTSPDIVRRFQREARAVTHLKHPNIVEVYDLGQSEDGTLYIAMELVVGQSLSAMIKAAGPMHPNRIVVIMGQVVSALSLAHHNNIIHRDLKPHNIMVSQNQDGHDVTKLLDFGIAKTFEIDANTQLTSTGMTLGTPQYMSPEQATGVEVDARSDLYSLGIILYEMLIGEVPFTDPSTPAVLVKHMTEAPMPPSRRRPDVQVSPELEAIALRCLEKDAAKRFQSADELGAELARVPLEPGQAADADGATIPLRKTAAPLSTQSAKPTVLDRTLASTAPPPPVLSAADAATIRNAATQPTAAPPVNVAPPPLPPPPPLPTPAPVPGTRPTVAAAVAPPPVAAVQPVVARKRSVLVPLAMVVVLLAILVGGGYWAWMRSQTPATEITTVTEAPPATPAGAEPAKPEPAPGVAAVVTSPVATTPTPAPATTSPRAAAPTSAPPARSTASAGAGPAAAPQDRRAAPATSQSSAIPATPSLSFRCTGPGEVCGPLKSAFEQAADREGLAVTRGGRAADVDVTAEVSIIDTRQQTQFGTTFLVSTYSIDLSGESARFDQTVPMPPSKSFSADARFGKDRYMENARLAAADAIERVQQFWKKHLP